MKTRLLIIVGLALMIEGFSAMIYSSFVLLPPVEPPIMRPIEGIDCIFYV